MTKKTRYSYTAAKRTPSERKPRSFIMPMNKPKPRSEITDYVETHRQDGDSTQDLVHEFQEECEHPRQRIMIAQSPTKRFMKCPDCGDIKEMK